MDILIKNGLIVTMDKARRVFRGDVGVENGRIAYVGRSKLFPASEKIDASGKIILPGFINVHSHGLHILWRGRKYERLSLYPWLFKRLFPLQNKLRVPQAREGIRLFAENCLRAGITTVLDSTDAGRRSGIVRACLEEFSKTHMRVLYGRSFFDTVPNKRFFTERGLEPNFRASFEGAVEDTHKALSSTRSLMKRFNTPGSRVSVIPFPAEPNLVSPKGLKGAFALAQEFNTIVSTHCSEVLQDSRINGLPTIEYLNLLGFLSTRTLLAHCTHISRKEISLISERGAKVAHNFSTNLFLRDGIAPIPELIRTGVSVGLGTDDANANSHVSILTDLKPLVLVHGLRSDVITPQKALEMATIDGARALGLEKEIGSIEVGKKADLVLVDATQPHMKPMVDVYSALVFQGIDCGINVVSNGRMI